MVDLKQAFLRYIRSIFHEANEMGIEVEDASFCRAVEHYANPENVEDFRKMILSLYGYMQRNQTFFVPPNLTAALCRAIDE
jgi:hypothetical protein